MRDDPDKLWEVLKAYQTLCNRLFDECSELRTQAPEEGGWVRTTNTAYRAPHDDEYEEQLASDLSAFLPEVPPEVPEVEEGPENAPRRGRKPLTAEQRNNISEATQGVPKKCSRCGREGVNVRTCLEGGENWDGINRQRHRQPILYIPKTER
jgi:hypothetical protein